MIMRKKIFKHGGSLAVDLPKEFVKNIPGREVVIECSDDEIVIRGKDELDTLESDPLFSAFIQAIAVDALSHPQKLQDPADAWSPEVVKLFHKMSDDNNRK